MADQLYQRRRRGLIALFALAILAAAWTQAPGIAAGALLFPSRRPVIDRPPEGCADATFDGVDVRLSGWRCAAKGDRRGTVILLHGVADNRAAVARSAPWFTDVGFDVIAYDSRAHGNSEGSMCTYGFFEKQDLRRVIDAIDGPVALLGTSLGGAVALQEAADDPRVVAVIAAEVFSDLRTIANERVPIPLPQTIIDRALALAEERARFNVDAVDVAAAAARITRPVFLIHGADDHETTPDHSRRVYASLRGPKQLLMVAGAGHNQSLARGDVWIQIREWLISATSRTTRY